MTTENIVPRAIHTAKRTKEYLVQRGKYGFFLSLAEEEAKIVAEGLLDLAAAAEAVVEIKMYCICGAEPDGAPHGGDCLIGVLASKLVTP